MSATVFFQLKRINNKYKPNGDIFSSQPLFTCKFMVKYPALNHSAISFDVKGPVKNIILLSCKM